jgi:sialate O-acetylesterase
MSRPRAVLTLVWLTLALAGTVRAEVRLPHMLSDHAVLQRQMPLHIWGWADPTEKVTVSFHAQAMATVADELGRWSVYLRPEPAGGPYVLTVQASNTIQLEDILVGDVWFASGQSNMEFPLTGFGGSTVLKDGPQEIANASQPQIRLLRFGQQAPAYELRDQSATWTLCTPETAAKFSAVAYFFARSLVQAEHVPIGVIDSTWGGTVVSAWLSLEGLSSDAGLMPEFAQRVAMTEAQSDNAALLAAEAREDAKAKAAGQRPPAHPWHPGQASWVPSALFNGMVAPATAYTIKGVIWYQGESDSSAGRAPLYERAFPAMITDWRARWGEGNFPFLFVQLSSFTSVPAETWGIIREAQRRTLKLANTAMAVSIDVGQTDNVHPPDKQTVGARLALAARAVAYGESVEFSGPLFRQATPEAGAMRVYFDHARVLTAKGSTSGTLEGFEVAGSDGQFHPATAHIDGDTVVTSSTEVARPAFVRYAWANAPMTANLYNADGLPASGFTSEPQIPLPCVKRCGP